MDARDARLSQLAAPPVFVVGGHRSGTTWVFDILTHPAEVAGVFESWLFTPDHGLGGLLHWGNWKPDHIEKLVKRFERRPGLGQLVDRDEVVDTCRRLAESWLGRVLEPHHRYIVEKSPSHLDAVETIRELWPDARFVHVVRDGRDVLVSRRAALSWDRVFLPKKLNTYREAQRWAGAMSRGRFLAGELGNTYTEIRYEDLAGDPHRGVRRLFDFCGIRVGDAVVASAIEATDFRRHYTGGATEFRRAGRVGDWRTRLGFVDRLLFHRGAGSALEDRGYETSRLWWLTRRKARQ